MNPRASHRAAARRPRERVAWGRLLSVAATTVVVGFATTTASALATQQSDRAEQLRYATETVNLSYNAYVARATDFRLHGCKNEPPNATVGCHKPPPYNAFNWVTDGCSPPTPQSWRKLFDRACQLHDFGYRNFGKGLTLGRNESTRAWIDNRFETEMVNLCNVTYSRWWQKANKVACVEEAGIMWAAVRAANYWGPATDPKPGPGGTPQPPPVATGVIAPGPPPPPPASLPTYSETTGGAANTWTNYSNAGGSHGPTIPANGTVAIACTVPGFRVADGDTWWYRIASSPWNGGFYVSADAFYNNGRTSGSLSGTPFVDGAVRDC